MRATDAEKALAADIWDHFLGERFDKARNLLDQALRESEHLRFQRIHARFLLFEGQEQAAAEALKPIIEKAWAPGSWELAIAGTGASRARILPDQKILFFPIPKCGSTSVMNVLKLILGEENRGEGVHDEDAKKSPVKLAQVPTKFAGYFSAALVRAPMDRIWSFYHGNIAARDQLAKHHDGANHFYGMSTRPDWDTFIADLPRYRQVFITARNHTEPVTSFLGTDASLFSWIGGLTDLPELVGKLSDHTGKKLPLLSEMKSPDGQKKTMPALPADLQPLYAADFDAFGRYF